MSLAGERSIGKSTSGNGRGHFRAKQKPATEKNTEQAIQVRQVTDVQASWTEHARGENGSFTIQLILDNGAEEYVLQPTPDDAKVMLKLFERSESVFFDLERQVLIPNNVSLG